MILRRRELRLSLLLELYDHHHASGGREKVERAVDMESERSLAYRYLVEKGYARKATEGMGYSAATSRMIITASGIDYIEQQVLEQGMGALPKLLPKVADNC